MRLNDIEVAVPFVPDAGNELPLAAGLGQAVYSHGPVVARRDDMLAGGAELGKVDVAWMPRRLRPERELQVDGALGVLVPGGRKLVTAFGLQAPIRTR